MTAFIVRRVNQMLPLLLGVTVVLFAVIQAAPGGPEAALLEGDVPSPAAPSPGCRLHTRCPFAVARCRAEEPAWQDVEPGHRVACHRVEELA